MSLLGNFVAGLRALFRKRKSDQEMDEELFGYLDAAAQTKMRAGMSRTEAERAARLEMGSAEAVKENIREASWESAAESLWRDVCYGARMLRKSPGFTAVALLTLALGIGANTAIFSAVNGILLQPLSYPSSDRLVVVTGAAPFGGSDYALSIPALRDLKSRDPDFEQVAGAQFRQLRLTGYGPPELLFAREVTGDYFSTLGMKPLVGRPILPSDSRFGSGQVVVLSYALWRSHFGADPGVIGRALTLDGHPYTIIGVMPPGFDTNGTVSVLGRVWVPLVPTNHERTSRDRRSIFVTARLKDGVTLAQANSHLATLSSEFGEEYPKTDKGWAVRAERLQDSMVRRARVALLVLLAAVGLVLLIACANVSNLTLARGWVRRKEAAIREAVGATSARLFRQFLIESVLLGLGGGAFGLVLALWGVGLLRTLAPPATPRIDQIRLDPMVFGYAFGISLLSSVLFGLIPALRVSRGSLEEALREGGSTTGTRIEGRWAGHLRGGLVIAEVALAFILAIGSSLTIRSFAKLTSVPLGFQPDHLVTTQVRLSPAVCRYAAPCRAAFDDIRRRVRSLSGIESAALSSSVPFSGYAIYDFRIEGQPMTPSSWQGPEAEYLDVSPGYFTAMGIPILGGRPFTGQDTSGTAPVAIVNQSLARRYFSGNALGKHIAMEGNKGSLPAWIAIVGEVGDVRDVEPASEPKPELYLPFDQAHPFEALPAANLLVRTEVEPRPIVAAIRQQVWAVDKNAPVSLAGTVRESLSQTVADPRFRALLLGLFGGLGLVLALGGIYGMLLYTAGQRRHEIAVRMVFGAKPRDVYWLVVRQGIWMIGVGIAIGVAGALGVTRFLRSLIYGLSPTDPVTFVGVASLTVLVGLAACYGPARRAIRVDPMVALHHE